MKKSFTLVELLSVIIILGIILSLAVPAVLGMIKKSKENAYNSQVEYIINAAKFYISDIKDSVTELDEIGGVYYVLLQDLNDNGYLELPILNPQTNANFANNNSWIKVRKIGVNKFSYDFVFEVVDSDAPIVIFGTNGSTNYVSTINTTVTVYDEQLTTSSLKYLWKTNATAPTESDFSTSFTNGATITAPSSVNGTYYLWILAKDTYNNVVIKNSNVFNIDDVDPSVVFSMNGNTTYAKTRSTTVTVSDNSSINNNSLKYLWKTNTTTPIESDFFTAFTNGATITTPTDVTGTYYLWILATDTINNTIITRSNVFNMDNQIPSVVFSMNGNTTYAKTRSTTVTVSDNSSVNISSLKYLWKTNTTAPIESDFSTSFTNGATITTPTDVTGTYYLWVLAKDTLNNVLINRSNVFNMDNIIPVITMLGTSPYVSPLGASYNDPDATASDNIDGDISDNIIATSTVVPTTEGTYTVTYNVTDIAGNTATPVVRTVNIMQLIYDFVYTGDVQSINISATGTYKLEVWGAQGGNAGYSSTIYTYGGKGGYAYGNKILTAGDVINVYVGGQGAYTLNLGTQTKANGGYNGGGFGFTGGITTSRRGAGGGGATDIRLNGTALTNRIIVAGAGAGGVISDTHGTNYPGHGGGTTGGNGYTSKYAVSYAYHGKGGTQTAGGAGGNNGSIGLPGTLGLGGNAGSAYGYGEAGGGAGYYGGGASGSGMGGGGGSSYITGLTNASTNSGIETMVAPAGGTQVGQSGNGYARISFVSS